MPNVTQLVSGSWDPNPGVSNPTGKCLNHSIKQPSQEASRGSAHPSTAQKGYTEELVWSVRQYYSPYEDMEGFLGNFPSLIPGSPSNFWFAPASTWPA